MNDRLTDLSCAGYLNLLFFGGMVIGGCGNLLAGDGAELLLMGSALFFGYLFWIWIR